MRGHCSLLAGFGLVAEVSIIVRDNQRLCPLQTAVLGNAGRSDFLFAFPLLASSLPATFFKG